MRISSSTRVVRHRPSLSFVIAASVGLGWEISVLVFSIIGGEYLAIVLSSAAILILATMLILHVRHAGTRVTTVTVTRTAELGEEVENGNAQTD